MLIRVDNDNLFDSFFAKKGSKQSAFFARKLCDYCDNRYFAKNYILAINAIIAKLLSLYSRFTLRASVTVSSMTLCNLYSLMPPLQPFIPTTANVSSTARVSSTALCSLFAPLSSLWPFVLSTALYSLYDPLLPLRPSVPSTALSPLYGPLFSLLPSVTLTALYCPLPPLQPSPLSMALCPLYSHLSPLCTSLYILYSRVQRFLNLNDIYPSLETYGSLYA
jgi:hypothetical protein